MASVAEIDGLTVPTGVPPAFTGLLDTYTGAAAAYSVRQLKSGITVAMRVRRETAAAGDNDEADVAFDTSFTNPTISLDSAISNASAGVTATTLGQFLNVGTVNGTTYTNPDSLTVTASCLTDTWYDQSGNANHAEQTTYAVQPKIHDGTVDTDLILDNGKPALEGSGDLLEFTAFNLTDDFAISHVGQYQTQDSIYGGSSGNFAGYGLTTTLRWRYSGSNVNFAFTYSTGQQYLDFLNRSSGSNTLHIDGTSIGTASNSNTFNLSMLLNGSGGNMPLLAKFQEFVLWESDQISPTNNRPGIEENINSEYLIYQPTDPPTSGLLYDYGSATGGTDAAAAYSVRQLSDKAILCMRIRRDMGAGNPGDDDEINIGFDANGDLDTQAIADFCTTGTGYVTRWWDQSVNGNHADQQTNGSEPQIYNGTAVITANGKPALQKTDRPTSLDLTTSLALSDFCVSWAGDRDSIRDEGLMLANTAMTEYLWDRSTLFFSYAWDGGSTTTGATGVGPKLYVINKNGSSINNRMNGTAYAATLAGTLNLDFAITPGVNSWEGEINEIIIWNSNKASEQTDIETDIDDYFNII